MNYGAVARFKIAIQRGARPGQGRCWFRLLLMLFPMTSDMPPVPACVSAATGPNTFSRGVT
jgi:hypothetical protein